MSETIKLPKAWDDWKIEELIGEGSFGVVYKATKNLHGIIETCAIKIIEVPSSEEINLSVGVGEKAQAYYQDILNKRLLELQSMVNLRGNSHIVSIEDYYIDEIKSGLQWVIYIRMEYLSCITSPGVRDKMTEEDIIRMGIDVCYALADCSNSGILHRDIKPENIFVATKSNAYKLGDFSEARNIETSYLTNSIRGTFSYIAPEVIKGENYSIKTDIYSLGLVLYRLMNRNRDPFLDPHKQIIYFEERREAFERRIRGEKLLPPCEASSSFSDVILRAAAFKPEERYHDAEEMRHDLERIEEVKNRKDNNRTWVSKSLSVFIGLLLLSIICILVFLKLGVYQKEVDRIDNKITSDHTESYTEDINNIQFANGEQVIADQDTRRDSVIDDQEISNLRQETSQVVEEQIINIRNTLK